MSRKTFIAVASMAVIALSGLAVSGSASAGGARGIKPLKHELHSEAIVAFDGTDLYSVASRRVATKHRYRWDNLVARESFTGSDRKHLFRVKGDREYIDWLEAGGGHVAFAAYTETDKGLDLSSVFRIARDGSTRELLASGGPAPGVESWWVEEGEKPVRSDCGTSVSVLSMSTDGGVVISEVTADRESKVCGKKPNVDHLRIYEVTLSGATREIFKTDHVLPPPTMAVPIDVLPVGGIGDTFFPTFSASIPGGVTVVGDRAIFQKSTEEPAYVRDLNSGALIGPFGTGLRGKQLAVTATISPAGSIAMNSMRVKQLKRGQRVSSRNGVFATPLNPSPFTFLRKTFEITYCGSRLIARISDRYFELDPVTLKKKRLVAVPSRYDEYNDVTWRAMGPCDDNYFYAYGRDRGVSTALAYPLGS